ncbi:MAG TPA: hypothetical protein PK992_15720 [Planctomycetaceae bacterium]|nr:hypothetical protein [Planctomycetaceae bacterium]
MQRGETKSDTVISDDMILMWKLIWSQVAAGLRSPFRQKGPTSNKVMPLDFTSSDHSEANGSLALRAVANCYSYVCYARSTELNIGTA